MKVNFDSILEYNQQTKQLLLFLIEKSAHLSWYFSLSDEG